MEFIKNRKLYILVIIVCLALNLSSCNREGKNNYSHNVDNTQINLSNELPEHQIVALGNKNFFNYSFYDLRNEIANWTKSSAERVFIQDEFHITFYPDGKLGVLGFIAHALSSENKKSNRFDIKTPFGDDTEKDTLELTYAKNSEYPNYSLEELEENQDNSFRYASNLINQLDFRNIIEEYVKEEPFLYVFSNRHITIGEFINYEPNITILEFDKNEPKDYEMISSENLLYEKLFDEGDLLTQPLSFSDKKYFILCPLYEVNDKSFEDKSNGTYTLFTRSYSIEDLYPKSYIMFLYDEES